MRVMTSQNRIHVQGNNWIAHKTPTRRFAALCLGCEFKGRLTLTSAPVTSNHSTSSQLSLIVFDNLRHDMKVAISDPGTARGFLHRTINRSESVIGI